MWTETTRRDYERQSGRYATDLTDEEFALIEAVLPVKKPLGRPRTTNFHEVINAILYLLRTGCQWRMMPKDFPPIHRRWVVERTFAWMGRNRRLAKDFEKMVETSMTYLEVAMIQLMIRRLARS